MATSDTLEKSRELSRPIETYEITLGSQVFRYTSAEDDQVISSNTFTAIPISRNQVTIGTDQQRRVLTVTVLATNEFAEKYHIIVPGESANVKLVRYQRDETPAFTTAVQLFEGKVQSVEFTNDGLNAAIAVLNRGSALSRNIPRVTYMGSCNAFLYDRFCGADPTLFNFIGTVASISGDDITVTGAGASGFDFVSGYCRPVAENDFRLIRAQSGDVLTLSLPFAMDPTSTNVQCFAGCDHLIDGDCALVFDRVKTFLGFAFVPKPDIFRVGVK